MLQSTGSQRVGHDLATEQQLPILQIRKLRFRAFEKLTKSHTLGSTEARMQACAHLKPEPAVPLLPAAASLSISPAVTAATPGAQAWLKHLTHFS